MLYSALNELLYGDSLLHIERFEAGRVHSGYLYVVKALVVLKVTGCTPHSVLPTPHYCILYVRLCLESVDKDSCFTMAMARVCADRSEFHHCQNY